MQIICNKSFVFSLFAARRRRRQCNNIHSAVITTTHDMSFDCPHLRCPAGAGRAARQAAKRSHSINSRGHHNSRYPNHFSFPDQSWMTFSPSFRSRRCFTPAIANSSRIGQILNKHPKKAKENCRRSQIYTATHSRICRLWETWTQNDFEILYFFQFSLFFLRVACILWFLPSLRTYHIKRIITPE